MFRGRGCSVRIQNVHFEGCPIIILDGAVVIFGHCTFSAATKDDCKGKNACYGVFAHGDSTVVSIANSIFSNSKPFKDPCVAQSGARMHLDRCMFRSFARTAVRATGKGTKISCWRSVMARGDTPPAPSSLQNPKGIVQGISITDGAHGYLWGCGFDALTIGVSVEGATADIWGTTAQNSVDKAIAVQSKSTVSFSSGSIYGCGHLSESERYKREGQGIHVDGDSTFNIKSCGILENSSVGLNVQDNAKVSVRSCEFALNDTVAIMANGEGISMYIADTLCREGWSGVLLQHCKECKLERVRSISSFTCFGITSVRKCNFLECTAEEFSNGGVAITGTCAAMSLQNCILGGCSKVHSQRGCALQVRDDSRVFADRCNITPGETADGINVVGANARLTLRKCDISAIVGLTATSSRIILTDCTTHGCSTAAIGLAQFATGVLTRHKSTRDTIAL